jgi:hypothetical protein
MAWREAFISTTNRKTTYEVPQSKENVLNSDKRSMIRDHTTSRGRNWGMHIKLNPMQYVYYDVIIIKWLYGPCKDLGHVTYWGFVILLRHTVGLLWTSDQPVAKASTYTGQHNIETQRQTSMPRAGFEPMIQAAKTYALDSVATGIGLFWHMTLSLCDLNTITVIKSKRLAYVGYVRH